MTSVVRSITRPPSETRRTKRRGIVPYKKIVRPTWIPLILGSWERDDVDSASRTGLNPDPPPSTRPESQCESSLNGRQWPSTSTTLCDHRVDRTTLWHKELTLDSLLPRDTRTGVWGSHLEGYSTWPSWSSPLLSRSLPSPRWLRTTRMTLKRRVLNQLKELIYYNESNNTRESY